MADVTGNFGLIDGVSKLVTHTRKDAEQNYSGLNSSIRWDRDNRICTNAGYNNFSYSQSFVLNSGVINYTDDTTMRLSRYNVDGVMVETGNTRRVKDRGGWFVK